AGDEPPGPGGPADQVARPGRGAADCVAGRPAGRIGVEEHAGGDVAQLRRAGCVRADVVALNHVAGSTVPAEENAGAAAVAADDVPGPRRGPADRVARRPVLDGNPVVDGVAQGGRAGRLGADVV